MFMMNPSIGGMNASSHNNAHSNINLSSHSHSHHDDSHHDESYEEEDDDDDNNDDDDSWLSFDESNYSSELESII